MNGFNTPNMSLFFETLLSKSSPFFCFFFCFVSFLSLAIFKYALIKIEGQEKEQQFTKVKTENSGFT